MIEQADQILTTASDAREVLEDGAGGAEPGQRAGGEGDRDGRSAGARRGQAGPDRVPRATRYKRDGRGAVIAALADRAVEHGRLAIDTEFVSERRYQAQLCLVQVAVPDEQGEDGVRTEVLDPIADQLDPGPLKRRAGRPRGRGDHARGPPGRGHPAADVADGDHVGVRHPGGRRVPGLRQPGGLRAAGAAGARGPPAGRRRVHPLGQAAADREAGGLRRGRRALPAGPGLRARAPAGGAGPRELGARGEQAGGGLRRRPLRREGLRPPAQARAAGPQGAGGSDAPGHLARRDRPRAGPPAGVRAARPGAGGAGEADAAGPGRAGQHPRSAPADPAPPGRRAGRADRPRARGGAAAAPADAAEAGLVRGAAGVARPGRGAPALARERGGHRADRHAVRADRPGGRGPARARRGRT